MRKYLKILANPLLYYSNKSGNSVFRNFSMFKQTGNLYHETISKADVGKVLEYRFYLNKKLRSFYILTALILYLIFIHLKFSITGLLFFELIYILLCMGAKLLCSNKYHQHLVKKFGQYEVVEFCPPVSDEKYEGYIANFKSKIIVILICIAILALPSLFLRFGIKHSLTPKWNGFKYSIVLSNIYTSIYPKTSKIYDMRAYANYMLRNYDKALNDYKIALNLSGRDFTEHDVVRLENLLFLQKKSSNSQDAIDLFEKYINTKRMTPLEKSQMLWIKSIFKIENHLPLGILEDYDNLIASLKPTDIKNQFYITCDKAYMLYLLEKYETALLEYNSALTMAIENGYKGDMKTLYAERGWTKKQLGMNLEANSDFVNSKIPAEQLPEYEPTYKLQGFVKAKF